MAEKFINIRFPFKESEKGFFVELNKTDKDAIRSDLMHLVLTRKGDRYYNPEFGTNLLNFIFEPNDGITYQSMIEDMTDTIKKYLPNLQVDKISVEQSENNEFTAVLTIAYSITDGVFKESDVVIINI